MGAKALVRLLSASAAAASGLSSLALADTAPIGLGDSTWAMRSVVGYSKTGGNSDTSAGNALFHAAHVMGNWKLLFGFDALYGSTRGETTAQAWDAYLQANYNITPRFYWYVGTRYDDDRFSGFAYQAAVKTGFGYKFIDTDATKLTVQAGPGYRRLRPEILVRDEIGAIVSRTEQPEESSAIADAGLAFEHNFNASTKLLAAATVQAGKDNTLTNASVALQVKMTDRLALSASYKLSDNSNPPPGSGHKDTLTSLGLVFEFKNDKLPADPQ
jgi:putative salt-induced outer membrane protein